MGPKVLEMFVARLGPYLGRLFRSVPALLPTLVAKLRTSGAVVGDGIVDILAWVKANPVNAILLSTTLATLGHSVADLFRDADEPDVKSFATDLDDLAKKALAERAGALKLINSADAANEHLKTGLGDDAGIKVAAAQQVLAFAKGFFGSADEAVKAHKYMQAFFEMSRSDVDFGFRHYRLDGVKLSLV